MYYYSIIEKGSQSVSFIERISLLFRIILLYICMRDYD